MEGIRRRKRQKDRNHFTLTKLKSGIWYYYAYDAENRRIRRSTGRKRKSEAVDYILRLIDEGALLYDADPGVKITFEEFSEPFWNWDTCPIIKDKLARGGHYSVDLCLSNRKTMEKHILPVFGKQRLSLIRRKDIDQWLLSLPDKAGISASTANKVFTILKQMLNVAVFDGLIEKSPADGIRPLIAEEKVRSAFSIEEIQKIFSFKWDSKIAYSASFLAAFTGMRLGEIRALRFSRIHPGYIVIDSSWSDNGGLKSTKSGKARVVSITERMYELLMELRPADLRCDEDRYVFSPDGKRPYEDRFFSNRLKDVMARCGIGGDGRILTFHSFRHYFNTQMVAAGISGEIIRNTIGHSSENMTDRYLHLGKDELQEVRELQNGLSGRL